MTGITRRSVVLTAALSCILMTVTGCVSRHNYAPVVETGHHQRHRSHSIVRKGRVAKPKTVIVRRGDTLYSIAWRYDLDYRQLAARNGIQAPYTLDVGQHLRLSGAAKRPQYVRNTPKTFKKTHTVGIKTAPKLSKYSETRAQGPVKQWYWPVRGHLTKRFEPRRGNKGIEIAAPAGTVVHAAAPGHVAYAGSGLRAYGNLLIIKHNSRFLSAYAHNRKLLVKEGQTVTAGQAIAVMGSTRRHSSRLHFEIRKAGKPVNPLWYLKRQRLASTR